MQRTFLINIGLAAALASGTILAQPLPDAKFLLAHSGDELKKHTTYQMEVETTGSVNGVSQPSTVTSMFGSGQDRMRMESEGVTIVADGHYTWTYMPSTGQYTKSAAIGNALETMLGSSMYAFVEKLRSAFAFKTVRQEKIEIDGQVIDCWVIEMKAENLPLPRATEDLGISASEFSGYYWIDKNTGLTRQAVSVGKVRLPNSPASQSVETKTVYRSLKFDEPLPDSLFQFALPAGAKEVANIMNARNLEGKAAPAFEVESLEGKPYRLSELKGKVILLDFWASWCAPCRQEMPSISKLDREWKGKDLLVIGVDVGEDRQTVEKFLKTAGISFPVALTSGTDIAYDYHVTSYPTYVVIGRDGVVAAEQVGGRGDLALRTLIAKGYGIAPPASSAPTTPNSWAAKPDTRQLENEIHDLLRMRDDPARRTIDLQTINTRLVEAWETLAGPESVVVAIYLYFLTTSLEQAGRLTEAEQAIQRAIAILEKHYGANAPSVRSALLQLATIDRRLGKNDRAREASDRASAIRQETPSQGVSRPGGAATTPRVLSKREPEYSERARKARIQGTVLVYCVVNTDGKPDDIKVVLPLGEGLDEKAVEALKTWRFQPGEKGGVPLPVAATLEFNFRLL
jgi:TonB family protein